MLGSLQESGTEIVGYWLHVHWTVQFPDLCHFRSLLQSKLQLVAAAAKVRNRDRSQISSDTVASTVFDVLWEL